MEVACNQRLLNFASNLHKQIMRFSYQTLHFQEHLETSRRFHEQIVQKILEKDRENACRLMQEHVLDAMHFLLTVSSVSKKGNNTQTQIIKTNNIKQLTI
jgi:DNA-binding GntR family transcriptional regulator